jgi:DNA-binding Xre family transcriptional regulator
MKRIETTMKIKLRNRLDVLMKDSGVKSVEELAQRLSVTQGYQITRTPLSRKFRDEDVQLPLSLIEAICNELQCLPGDLFQIDVSDATPEFVDEIQSRVPPFRYGSLRMRKQGTAESTEQDQAEPLATPTKQTRKTAPKSSPDVDDDDVAGPKVSHLNVSKLNRKS